MKLDQENLNKIQSMATILSLIAIPIIIAVVGWRVQASISNEGIKKDYVQMALEILKNPEKQQDTEMRKWAVAVLDQNAPVPFSKELRESLEKGSQRIYYSFPEPPEILMRPPLKLKPLTGNTFGDTTLNLVENAGRCRQNEVILEHLQKWNRDMSHLEQRTN